MKPSKKLLAINLEVLKELSGKQRAGVKGGTDSAKGALEGLGRATGDSGI